MPDTAVRCRACAKMRAMHFAGGDTLTHAQSLLSLRSVTQRYGAIAALNDVSLEIGPGLTSILGPNGAGKTTLLALLLGQLRPQSGDVSVLGEVPGAISARRRMGAMLQAASLSEQLTVAETVSLFCSYYPRPRTVTETLQLAGLEALATRRYKELSGGQKRRVQFAVAICGRPELLLLDEPTVALDSEARRQTWGVIRSLVEQGCSVILTTHQLEEAEALSSRVVVLAAGKIVADGTPAAIKSRVAACRVRCTTRFAPAELTNRPGVHEARVSGRHVELLCERAEPIVKRLLDEDSSLAELTVTGASLEDAVLELTKEQAR
jgi:ABC-2 type transport system ATP-binding protein